MKINSYEDFCSYQNVSRETYDKLSIYEKTLIKWQGSINLISKSTINDIWVRHFLDSAQLYPITKDIEGNILDFGSGAGFPGLILAIMGHKNITLVESDQKKCTFLREVARLSETDVSILHSRIENLEFREVDLVVSRALAPLSKLISYVESFVIKSPSNNKVWPKMLFLKGKSYKNEILELKRHKNLFFDEYPSLTDEQGKIIYFSVSNMLISSNEK